MTHLNFLLYPLALVYGAATGLRNLFFDLGILKSRSFDIPVLCVGNISVGGTGKTPHTELIIDELRKKFRVACLSRGYRRKSSGFVLADAASTAERIGDEPYQMWKKFPDIIMACDADRVRGIRKLMALPTPPEVIILDDGFQHRHVKADKNIVLIDYNHPISSDHLLPVGRLRESTSALKRADYIILTKCPESLQPIERRIFSKQLEIRPYQQLFFTTTGYGSIHTLEAGAEVPEPGPETHILCVTGIARPQPYIGHLKTLTPHVDCMRFPDHHNFTARDIAEIGKRYAAHPAGLTYIFTTEKDASRLSGCRIPDGLRERICYIPVIPSFLHDGPLFLHEISEYVRKNQR